MKAKVPRKGKRRVEAKFMGGEKVKDVEVGDTHCHPCNMDFPTTKSLRSHSEKCHAGNVLYQCSECGKELMSKEGMEKHKLQHGDKKDVEVGDTHCHPCNMDFPTTKSLRSHSEKCHAGNVLYQCSECGKELMSKEGMEKHKLQHGDKKDMIPCKEPGCTVTFARPQSLKKHMKSKHGPGAGKKYQCSYCKKEVSSVDNKKAHEMGCKENRNRKELFCGLCNKGGFCLPKCVMEHKRDVHGFV